MVRESEELARMLHGFRQAVERRVGERDL